MINVPKHIRMLKPYKSGKPIEELAREKKLTKIVKLASNENPLGPSPKAIEAGKKCMDQVHRYVDPVSYDLVSAIAKKYKLRKTSVIAGHGTDSLLADVIAAFSNEGDEIVTSEGTFIGIFVNANKLGRSLKLVPLKDFCYDLDGIKNAITSKTRFIYLANPNNPTGTIFKRKEFEAFMASIPNNILVILDEAYYSYADVDPEYPDGATYEFDNMVVLRTFSKIYGLGGIRIGFAFGPKYLIDHLYKLRLPFEPNLPAQQAAIAALSDDEFLKLTIATNKKSLKMFEDCFKKIGIRYAPSWGNFFMMIFPDEAFAGDFYTECLNRGLILRHVNSFGIPNGVRINSGTIDETEFAITIIEEVYKLLLNKRHASDEKKDTNNEVSLLPEQ